MFKYKNISITKYPQSGFRIDYEDLQAKKNQIIYIDPFRLPHNQPKADIVFLSHEHHDHLDVESLKKIVGESTQILGNQLVKQALSGQEFIRSFETLTPWFQKGINQTIICLALDAYNTNKINSSGKQYHPKENEGLGFILEFNINTDQEIRVYFMGDTDFVEDKMTPVNIDILMVPVSGTYVMTKQEAVLAVNTIKPKVAIPMHYDTEIVGSLEDAEYLKNNCSVEVEIL